MSDCQKSGARASLTGRAYLAVLPIFDSLPEQFGIRDVMRRGKIQSYLDGAVRNVLSKTFKCIQIGERGATWKKQ